jgi:ubiquinone/menaquinone biosynthesis C-methylase UbiE
MGNHLDFERRDATADEILDAACLDGVDFAGSLGNLDRLGGALGWTALAVRDAARYAERRGLSSLRVLDIGTGAANVPVALARWGRRAGVPVRVSALDISPAMLEVARRCAADYPEIECVLGDALDLPFPAESFDLVLCQGALHHFDPEAAVCLLKEAGRVTKGALAVTDLRRSPLLYAGAWILLHGVVANAVTRHDGLASIRRAYVPVELMRMARDAGLEGARVEVTLHFRMGLRWERSL